MTNELTPEKLVEDYNERSSKRPRPGEPPIDINLDNCYMRIYQGRVTLAMNMRVTPPSHLGRENWVRVSMTEEGFFFLFNKLPGETIPDRIRTLISILQLGTVEHYEAQNEQSKADPAKKTVKRVDLRFEISNGLTAERVFGFVFSELKLQ